MRSIGEQRVIPRVLIAVVLLTVAGAVWWQLRRHAAEAPATSMVVQPQRGSASTRPAMIAQRALPIRLAIAVSDDRGPLAGATVRLAPGDGDVVVIKTERDGVAHADRLTAGTWKISASAADHVPAALRPATLAGGADEQVAIKLALGGRTLRGTVTDATGGPVAGARIDAARLTALAEAGDAVSTTVTGGDGRYWLTVAEGALRV